MFFWDSGKTEQKIVITSTSYDPKWMSLRVLNLILNRADASGRFAHAKSQKGLNWNSLYNTDMVGRYQNTDSSVEILVATPTNDH